MNDHHFVRRNLPLFVARELSRRDCDRVERHIRGCASCSTMLRQQRHLDGWLRAEAATSGAVDSRSAPTGAVWPRVAAVLLAFAGGYLVAGWRASPSVVVDGGAAANRIYRNYVDGAAGKSELFRALAALSRPTEDQ